MSSSSSSGESPSSASACRRAAAGSLDPLSGTGRASGVSAKRPGRHGQRHRRTGLCLRVRVGGGSSAPPLPVSGGAGRGRRRSVFSLCGPSSCGRGVAPARRSRLVSGQHRLGAGSGGRRRVAVGCGWSRSRPSHRYRRLAPNTGNTTVRGVQRRSFSHRIVRAARRCAATANLSRLALAGPFARRLVASWASPGPGTIRSPGWFLDPAPACCRPSRPPRAPRASRRALVAIVRIFREQAIDHGASAGGTPVIGGACSVPCIAISSCGDSDMNGSRPEPARYSTTPSE